MGWKHTTYHSINSDPVHTRSKRQLDKNLKITFTSPSKSTDEKEKVGKKRKAIAKRFALHVKVVNSFRIIPQRLENRYVSFVLKQKSKIRMQATNGLYKVIRHFLSYDIFTKKPCGWAHTPKY